MRAVRAPMKHTPPKTDGTNTHNKPMKKDTRKKTCREAAKKRGGDFCGFAAGKKEKSKKRIFTFYFFLFRPPSALIGLGKAALRRWGVKRGLQARCSCPPTCAKPLANFRSFVLFLSLKTLFLPFWKKVINNRHFNDYSIYL
jgi:hypothetical protein